MDINTAIQTAADFIAGEESFSSRPYYDVNGYAIGYGNHYYEDGTPVAADDDEITEPRAFELLSFYVNQNAAAIASQVTAPLNSNQLAALTSIRYNCGTITNALLGLINSGADAETVADKILTTCATAGGKPSEVLDERRSREADLYVSGPGIRPGILVGAAVAVAFLVFITK